MSEVAPPQLPPGSLLLHVGPPKTGTTAIQVAMHESRSELAEHGVFYPGPFEPAPPYRPAEATRAVLGVPAAPGRRTPRIETWERLAAELAGHDLPLSVVSSETFARADDAGAARVLADLGPERTHVVYTARRIDRLLPSHWQERVKARLTWPWHDYVRRLAAPEPPSGEGRDRAEWELMWHRHDIAGNLRRWTQGLPPDRFTLLIADEDDHDLLSRTFGAMLGVPVELLRPPPGSNRSLTFTQAEVVRRVNQLFAEHDWPPAAYRDIVQMTMAPRFKAVERTEGAPPDRVPGVPADALEAIHERSDAQVEAILSSGVRIIGDPETLRTRGRVTADDSPDTLAATDLDTFGAAMEAALLGAFTYAERRVRRAERSRPEQPEEPVGLLARLRDALPGSRDS